MNFPAITPRRVVLLIPVAFLALSLDRILPEPRLKPPKQPRRIESMRAAFRELTGRNGGRRGKPGNALNLVFIGTPEAVRGAMTAAGWTEVPGTIRESFAAGFQELLQGKPLAATPPMNDYWIDGRRQDMNWALPIKPILARHHFRLWDTGMRDPEGRVVWWGSGDYDLDVRWHDFSHIPDPDMNVEREFIAEALRPHARRISYEALPQIPREYANDKGYPFRNDGRAVVIELSAPAGVVASR